MITKPCGRFTSGAPLARHRHATSRDPSRKLLMPHQVRRPTLTDSQLINRKSYAARTVILAGGPGVVGPLRSCPRDRVLAVQGGWEALVCSIDAPGQQR